MSDYYESEVEPLWGSEDTLRCKRKTYAKLNGQYSYQIRIIEENTGKSVYETVSCGKNQKDAVINFRKNDPEIRRKYLELGGYVLGVLRF